MDRGIFRYRSGDEDVLTKSVEEWQFVVAIQIREHRGVHGSLMPKQFAKREIPPLQHASVDRRPFRKDDVAGLLTYCIERQGITPDDVSLKDKPHRLAAL